MTLIKDLLQRRVPQILGIYLATSWAIIEFLDWFINHYSISPHLSEFGLITLASLIPSVLMIAYFHGKPGKDTWTKTEKIGIPVNVAGAMLLLFFLFKGKELGATTSLVSVEDEEGQLIERMIPKSEFRKKIMVHPRVLIQLTRTNRSMTPGSLPRISSLLWQGTARKKVAIQPTGRVSAPSSGRSLRVGVIGAAIADANDQFIVFRPFYSFSKDIVSLHRWRREPDFSNQLSSRHCAPLLQFTNIHRVGIQVGTSPRCRIFV